MAECWWPENSPENLENLCLQVCVQQPETFTEQDDDGFLQLRPGVSLLPGICDRLLSTAQEENNDVLSWIFVFSDSSRTRLTRVHFSDCCLNDDELDIVTNHPIQELVFINTLMPSNVIECINKLSRTLRILKFDFDEDLSDDSSNVNIVKHMWDLREIESLESILNCYNLKILSLRNFESHDGNHINLLPKVLAPLKNLSHLDLTRSNVEVESMECLGELQGLIWLCLSNIPISDLNKAMEVICQCPKLRHLDLSHDHNDMTRIVAIYPEPEEALRYMVKNLPLLTSLDLSGTDLPKIHHKPVEHRLGPVKRVAADVNFNNSQERDKTICVIKGLEGKEFDFLGLLSCKDDPCKEEGLPARQVTGHHNEEQILISIQRYFDRKNSLAFSLNHLFQLFRYSTVTNHCAALEAILLGMKENKNDRQVQISGSASLFYIVKGTHKNNITSSQKRRLVTAILDAMSQHRDELTMLRNGCLTICNLQIPEDVMFCYKRLVEILMTIIVNEQQEEFIQRLSIYLLNSLACGVYGEEKEMVGKLGAVEAMLKIIDFKLKNNTNDEVLEVAWSTLWNVTDETASNCDKFMQESGMELFLNCYQQFKDVSTVLRNMMGLMGNIAEVPSLRQQLMNKDYITVFSELLDSENDGIEISYNSAGIFSHILADEQVHWTVTDPSRDTVIYKMKKAIERWPLDSKRNINYRSFVPILSLVQCYHTQAAQHWAIWALANLTKVYPPKYCPLLKSENGVQVLRELLEDPRPLDKTKGLARIVIDRLLSLSFSAAKEDLMHHPHNHGNEEEGAEHSQDEEEEEENMEN